MRKYLKYIPYYLVIFFFYWPLYELLLLLISDSYTLKGLYIYNILLFSPLVTFIVSLLYSYRFRFSLWWLLGIGLVFCFTIITFGEFILLYFLAYELFALLGLAAGMGIKHVFQREKNKKIIQKP
ncbi:MULTISPECIES: hypothetical protein [Streptococcus]|uniref:Uncharacterized protein n=1 Tax=Streptococcus halitosis TaxID=2172545 RepID=A0A426FW66_9STRE|nr:MULTISPECIES: hypothetical protein [Streptococcus]EMG33174.1 hypothetical protein H354_03534 [Streptococcus oralis subsp. tigurinus AZ_3a]EJO20781.1 hypothetical protein HMPREF1149_0106 [Streptococcus sp. BS35b]ETS89767.1 hypothetical protein HMPREF1513_0397 [Streptococcus sp. BS29a]EUB27814.1 hypothetical protein HMPREF1515_1575 [Streptococcus sp. BS21]MCY7091814.1 hypothetical protein [Streptococcus oralis]